MIQSNNAAGEKCIETDEIDSKDVLEIIDKHEGRHGGLMGILGEIQETYGFLPENALRIVGERTGRSMVDIYGVATFYRSFSLKPRGKHLICACLGTACHVRGAPRIVDELIHQLGIEPGQTTEDKEFTLETVNCLGACALGPVVVIDGHYFSQVTKARVRHLLDQATRGFDSVDVGKDERIFPIEVNCPHCNHSLMDESHTIDCYPSIKLNITINGSDTCLRLSCLYGSYNYFSEVPVPDNAIVRFSCPKCCVDLPSTSDCWICGAPMAPMLVQGGGILRICSRRTCKNHILDLV